MKHQKIQNQLSAYLDNELTSEERRVVDKHLPDCPECMKMLEDFQLNQQQIAGLIHPAPSMKNAVLEIIQETETASKKGILSIVRQWVFRPFTVGATAFSTICLMIALFYMNPAPNPQYDELLEYYFGFQTEDISNNPLKSNVVVPISNQTVDTEEVMEDTDTLFNFYLGEE